MAAEVHQHEDASILLAVCPDEFSSLAMSCQDYSSILKVGERLSFGRSEEV